MEIYVKIISCSSDLFWYYSEINNMFKIERKTDYAYYCTYKQDYPIMLEDCMEISKEEYDTRKDFEAYLKPIYKKGKWYKVRNGVSYLNIVKCSKDSYDQTEIKCDENINLENEGDYPPDYEFERGSKFSNIYEFSEIDIKSDLLQAYLPNDHIDKLVEYKHNKELENILLNILENL